MDITATIETISPERATEMLGNNPSNRSLRLKTVEKLAGAIERNEWELNGETIKITADGQLIDGQHRLAAIAKAERAVQCFVIRGLPLVARESVDQVGRRTLGDILKMRGLADTNNLAAAVVHLWRYENHRERVVGPAGYPTIQQALLVLERHPSLPAHISMGRRLRQIGVSHSLGAYLSYIFHSIDVEDAHHFLETLLSGVGLQEGDPILALRQTLERDAVKSRMMKPLVKHAIIIKGWNAYRRGEQGQKVFIWRPGGSAREAFPRPE